VIIEHLEANSLHGEGTSHDWLERSSIVVKGMYLEAWPNFCSSLSKAKVFIHMNCGTATVQGKAAEE